MYLPLSSCREFINVKVSGGFLARGGHLLFLIPCANTEPALRHIESEQPRAERHSRCESHLCERTFVNTPVYRGWCTQRRPMCARRLSGRRAQSLLGGRLWEAERRAGLWDGQTFFITVPSFLPGWTFGVMYLNYLKDFKIVFVLRGSKNPPKTTFS